MIKDAKLLIDQPGEDAAIFAPMRVDDLADVLHMFYLNVVNEDG